jgi:hypothetical protein
LKGDTQHLGSQPEAFRIVPFKTQVRFFFLPILELRNAEKGEQHFRKSKLKNTTGKQPAGNFDALYLV